MSFVIGQGHVMLLKFGGPPSLSELASRCEQEPTRADSGIARDEVYRRDSMGATYGGSSYEAVHQGVSAAFRSRTASGPFSLGLPSTGEVLALQAEQQAREEAVQESLGYPGAVQETLEFPEAGQEHLVYPEGVREPDDEERDFVPPLAASSSVTLGSKPLQQVGSLGAAPPDFDAALLTFVNQPPAVHPPSPSYGQYELQRQASGARPSPRSPNGAPDLEARSPGASPGATAWSHANVVEMKDASTLTFQDGAGDAEEPDAFGGRHNQGAVAREEGRELEAGSPAEGGGRGTPVQGTTPVGIAPRRGGVGVQFAEGVVLEAAMQVSPFAAVMGRPLLESSSPSVETESGKSTENAGGSWRRGDWTTGELQLDAGQEMVPRRQSQLHESEPTLAAWSNEDEAPVVPQVRYLSVSSVWSLQPRRGTCCLHSFPVGSMARLLAGPRAL